MYLRTLKNLIAANVRWSIQSKNVAVIFLFHTIEDNPSPLTAGHRYITSVSRFRNQLAWILNNYQVVSTNRLLKLLASQTISKPIAAIHFDDGFRTYLDTALPILRHLGIPSASFFVLRNLQGEIPTRNKIAWLINSGFTTELVSTIVHFIPELTDKIPRNRETILAVLKSKMTDKIELAIHEIFRKRAPSDMRTPFINVEEATLLAACEDIEIGSHTIRHPMLSQLTEKQQKREIVDGHRLLEELLDRKVPYFAYPFGGFTHFNSTSRNIVESMSDVVAFSAHGGVNSDLRKDNVYRITLAQHTNLEIKSAVTSGYSLQR